MIYLELDRRTARQTIRALEALPKKLEKKRLLRKLGRYVLKVNKQRLRNQKNLDGAAMTKRKKNGREKMFKKIGQAKFLKITPRLLGNYGARLVYRNRRTASIAYEHQKGLIGLPKRDILGVAEEDQEKVYQFLRQQLQPPQ